MKNLFKALSLLLVSATTSMLYSQTTVTEITGNLDSFRRANTDAAEFNLISNDILKINNVTTPIILSGPNKNASISKAGAWLNSNNNPEYTYLSGVQLTSDGKINIPSGTPKISHPLAYKICTNDGKCINVPVFVNSMSQSNIDNNNIEITSGSTLMCDESVIKVDNRGLSIPAGSITYYYYISYDNGDTWTLAVETINAHENISFTLFEGEPLIMRKAVNRTNGNTSFSTPLKIKVEKNHIYYSNDNYYSIPINTTITLPTATSSRSSTITITDPEGNIIPQNYTKTFTTPGTYIYTVTAKANQTPTPVCDSFGNITVQVYESLSCNEIKERTYASSQNWVTTLAGGVDNPGNAIDNDPFTKSVIVNGLTLLGLGSTYQNLLFTEPIPAGETITVKLGQNYSLLQLAGGITIAPINQSGAQIGPLQSVNEGALLDLLTGPNIFEHSFIAKDYSQKQIQCYGVRVVLGSVLAIGATADLFGAYYEKISPSTSSNSNVLADILVTGTNSATGNGLLKLNPTTQDVLYGVEDIGLGVASALSTIANPYYAVDDDLESYCSFVKAAGVANQKRLTVVLRQPARPGDQIRVILGGGGIPLLDLDIVNSFKIQRYYKGVKVGPAVTGSSLRVLDLDLFNIFTSRDNRKVMMTFSTDQPFDRVELTDLSVVTVGLLGDVTKRIYDVSVIPSLKFEGQLSPNEATPLCAGSFLQVLKQDGCTDYTISLAYQNVDASNAVIGYTEISNSNLIKIGDSNSRIFYSFTRLYPQYDGNLYLKLQTTRNNLPYGEPQYMKITLANCTTAVTNPVISTK